MFGILGRGSIFSGLGTPIHRTIRGSGAVSARVPACNSGSETAAGGVASTTSAMASGTSTTSWPLENANTQEVSVAWLKVAVSRSPLVNKTRPSWSASTPIRLRIGATDVDGNDKEPKAVSTVMVCPSKCSIRPRTTLPSLRANSQRASVSGSNRSTSSNPMDCSPAGSVTTTAPPTGSGPPPRPARSARPDPSSGCRRRTRWNR